MTEAPLRAFLMLRSSDGIWTVTVCRDLGAVIHTWKMRQEPDHDVAVLHVGFERPPSHTFNQIGEANPGCMLLTAAAKHVLPSSFIVSVAPVGIADNIEVFIGLQGWGYTLEDPTAETCYEESPYQNTAVQEPQDWVASYFTAYPSDVDNLSEKGIFDEASYIEREVGLDRDMRHRVGMFRVHHNAGANCEDPCKLARVAPPWLADMEIVTMDLPVRVVHVFQAGGINTVRDLGDWSLKDLLREPNFGQKSLRDTLEALNYALNYGPSRTFTAVIQSERECLLDEVRRSLSALSDRKRDVLIRRLGFETKPETLQEIAEKHGITRERIRQIEVRVFSWIRKSPWADILVQKITRLLIDRSFPLPVAGVEAIDKWFEGVSSHRLFFKNLVQVVCEGRIHMVHIDGLYFFSLMTQANWEQSVSEASDLLSSGIGQGWSEDYARSLVHALLPDTAKEFGTHLWDRSSQLCHFSAGQNSARVLISYGRGAEQLVEAIMAESDTPLHYTEIARRANLRDERNLDTRRAHSAAANVGYLLAPGTYGLRRHVPLTEEQMSEIRTEAEHIVNMEPACRQWHTSEIVSEILKRLGDCPYNLDKYVVDIALASSSILRPLGRMTWIVTCEETDDQSRIDIHQAIVAIIKDAGHPLSAVDIKKKLMLERGVSEYFQIHPIKPLIQLESGLWGINNRDL